MMIAFFQTLFVFGHRPWKVADPKTKDHMGVGAFNLIRRRVYDALGTYQALRFEVLDDMKLGKMVKNAGYAQRNVFGADLISLRWAKGAMGMVNNLTKNFFAIMSFQWWRVLLSAVALAFLNLMPFLGICLAHGWARLPYAVALASMFGIYVGNVVGVRRPGILLCLASHQHDSVRLHHAAFDDVDPRPRRGSVARHVLSIGRIEKGNGVTGCVPLTCHPESSRGSLRFRSATGTLTTKASIATRNCARYTQGQSVGPGGNLLRRARTLN